MPDRTERLWDRAWSARPRAWRATAVFGLEAMRAAFARGVAGEPLLEQIATRLQTLYGDAVRFDVGVAAAGAEGSFAGVELGREANGSDAVSRGVTP